MQLFYAINDLAGRCVWIDGALRFFYVGAVPLLATLLAALLIFAPRHLGAASRRRVAFAAAIAIALCVLTVPALNAFTRAYLETDVLSPRPFVTHRVNLLVVEPNDNSFPCAEVMLCAALATLICAASPRWGIVAGLLTIVFGFARVFCGSNFAGDVGAGWILGGAWAGLALASCRASLHCGLRDGRRVVWHPKFQGTFAAITLIAVTAMTLFVFSDTPRFGPKIRGWFNVPRTPSSTASLPSEAERASSTLTSQEGEGVAAPIFGASSPADTSRDQHRSDYIPKADTLFRNMWLPLRLPHRILTVDVAQVRAGDTAYRSATVRFIVEKRGPAERRRVLQTATLMARTAFHADAQLQNIDLVGVSLNAEAQDYAPRPTTVPGPLPVFSASVARRDLAGRRRVPAALAASNPGAGEADAAWLRARSLLYFNQRVLPMGAAPAAPRVASF